MDLTKSGDCTQVKVSGDLLDLAVDSGLHESSGEEKCDINPEHSKKSDTSPDEESVSDSLEGSGPTKDNRNCDKVNQKPGTDVSSRSLAFTIDFGEDKVINSKKYNDIVERFQKRHRRGVSLSKLDDKNQPSTNNTTAQSPLTKSKPPLKKSFQRSSEKLDKCETSPTENQVKLRDKSLLHANKDSGHRHSWSPRTSVNVTLKPDEIANANLPGTFKPKSTILRKALQDIQKSTTKPPQSPTRPNFVCSKPPLDFQKNSDDESVSEAGTYTLDGDNYTEEQKAKMCIDQVEKDLSDESSQQNQEKFFHVSSSFSTIGGGYQSRNLNYCDTRLSNIEPDLKIVELDNGPRMTERRQKNILEVTYTQGMISDKPKTSYLEKIKSKVRTIGDKAFHKAKSPDKPIVTPPKALDIGSFTSVTASGVFSRAMTNQAQQKLLTRRNSLTQSQIDSSEYVQRSGFVNDKLFNSYTDYEKARHNEYKLNIFSHPGSSITDAEKETANSGRLAVDLEHAETKNDWIKEWAKSARRNTDNITKKYSKYKTDDDYSNQFGDNLDRNFSMASGKKTASNRYNSRENNVYDYEIRPRSANAVSHGTGIQSKHSSPTAAVQNYYVNNYRSILNEFGVGSEFESADDLSSPSERAMDSGHFFEEHQHQPSGNVEKIKMMSRPPISPTKIPSPMHSLRRGRSSSVTKDVHGSNMELNDTEMYLHKTAAAISTLQKIHRNNSPQSPLSPEKKAIAAMVSPLVVRRQPKASNYQIDQSAYTAIRLQQLHKRNNSVDGIEYKPNMLNNREMSHSYDPDQMNLALNSKPHTRHNSYEDRTTTFQRPMVHKSIEQTFSPQILMRSNISTKYQQPATNIKIKPASTTSVSAASNQIKRSSSFSTKQLGCSTSKSLTPKLAPKNQRSSGIQKSASSTSFKNMTSSYNDVEYYLNDEDDLNPDHICSSESDLSETDNEKEPITNTRYNKAFLIRMEQNKQKAVASQTKQGPSACPNTPEMPRRENRIRSSLRDRASMPRDSSLNRMKQDIPSLNISKKVLTTKEKTPSKKIQPKYLDISKYKPDQGNAFLKRDESKSTLINKEIKRSTSASVGFNKSDTGRSSMRSVKSASSAKSSTPVPTKEAELAMWRRRASYDPMKAAAEGKRKQEEARKAMQSSKYNESSVVLRSQSFHNGVGQTNNNLRDDPSDDVKHRWTLISTESSDDEFIENY